MCLIDEAYLIFWHWYDLFALFFGLQVMDLVVKEKLVLEERRISLSEFHTADEVSFYYFILFYFLGISAV